MSSTVKKIGTLSVITASLFVASWGAQAAVADAASATVNITATVQGSTCTPSWKNANPVTVDLGKVASSDLTTQGEIGALKAFILTLSKCDTSVTKVEVTASGTADDTDADAFANTAAGGATGVAVTLFGGDAQDTQLKPDGSKSVEYEVKDGAANMSFLAKLERSAAADSGEEKAVTDGAVSSTATLNMTYE